MRVWDGLDQPVASEGLLVGVSGFQALLAVGDLAGNTGLHRLLGRVLVAELAEDLLAGRHAVAVKSPLPAGLAGGVGPAHRGFLKPVDDVLQGDVALEPL